MNDVKAAAERVRRVVSGEKISVVYGTTPEIVDTVANAWFERDLEGDAKLGSDHIALIAAYLAEHPADDGEPITEEWLRECAKDSAGSYFVLSDERGKEVDVVKWSGGWNFRIHDGHNCKTRGDVRRLCAALGINLKEPKHE